MQTLPLVIVRTLMFMGACFFFVVVVSSLLWWSRRRESTRRRPPPCAASLSENTHAHSTTQIRAFGIRACPSYRRPVHRSPPSSRHRSSLVHRSVLPIRRRSLRVLIERTTYAHRDPKPPLRPSSTIRSWSAHAGRLNRRPAGAPATTHARGGSARACQT